MDNLRDEIWKDIEGYEGYYQVSNMGRVRSLDRLDRMGRKWISKIKKLQVDTKGYLYVSLCKNSVKRRFFAHRLVAKAFIPNPYKKPEVNHIDHNPQNNISSNLEWCTRQENVDAAMEFGKYDDICKRVYQVDPYSSKIVNEFYSVTEAANYMNCSRSSLLDACVGRSKGSCGFVWVYDKEEIKGSVKRYFSPHGRSIKVDQVCVKSNKIVRTYNSFTDACSGDNNFDISSIAKCCRGERKTHGGYKWRYAEEVN